MRISSFRWITIFLMTSITCLKISFAGTISDEARANNIDGLVNALQQADLSKLDHDDFEALKKLRTDPVVGATLLQKYRQAMERSPFGGVPTEIVLLISSFLNLPDISRLSRSCHQMQNYTSQELVRRAVQADLGKYSPKKALSIAIRSLSRAQEGYQLALNFISKYAYQILPLAINEGQIELVRIISTHAPQAIADRVKNGSLLESIFSRMYRGPNQLSAEVLNIIEDLAKKKSNLFSELIPHSRYYDLIRFPEILKVISIHEPNAFKLADAYREFPMQQINRMPLESLEILMKATPQSILTPDSSGDVPLTDIAYSGRRDFPEKWAMVKIIAENFPEAMKHIDSHFGDTVAHRTLLEGEQGLDALEIIARSSPEALSIVNRDGETPAKRAVGYEITEAIQIIAKHAPSSFLIPDSQGITPILEAASRGNWKAARIIAESAPESAHVTSTSRGSSLLELAERNNSEDAKIVLSFIPKAQFLKKAIELEERVSRKSSSNQSLTFDDLDDLAEIAKMYSLGKEFGKAASIFENVVRQSGSRASNYRAYLYGQAGDNWALAQEYEKAVEAFSRADKLDGKESQHWLYKNPYYRDYASLAAKNKILIKK